MVVVKQYFDEHYDQNLWNYKNYPKKLTSYLRRIITNNINITGISHKKACSVDGL